MNYLWEAIWKYDIMHVRVETKLNFWNVIDWCIVKLVKSFRNQFTRVEKICDKKMLSTENLYSLFLFLHSIHFCCKYFLVCFYFFVMLAANIQKILRVRPLKMLKLASWHFSLEVGKYSCMIIIMKENII